MTTVRAARALTVAGLTLGVAGLVGWLFDVGFLRSTLGSVTMNPMAAAGLAVCALAAAVATWPPRTRPRRAWAVALGALAAGLGALRLLGYAGGAGAGMDRWLFPRTVGALGSRVSPLTSVDLVVCGAAVVLSVPGRRRARALSHGLFLAAGFVALAALAGYLYGAPRLHGPMSFDTALGFLALAAAGVCAEPDYGLAGLLRLPGPGGRMARLALPVATLLPLALGWAGTRGQQEGLYATATGTALLVVLLVALLTPFLAWSARTIERQSERTRLLFERGPVAAWVFDLETLRFLQVNAAAVAQYGYSREEFLGMTIAAIRPPEDVPALYAALGEQHGGQPATRDWRHRRKDGSLLDVRISSHRLEYNGRPAGLVLAQDVTAERRMVAALTASENRFRGMAASANDVILSADAAGAITWANPAVSGMFGWTPEELAGQPLGLLLAEGARADLAAELRRYAADGDSDLVGRTTELAGLRRDGGGFPLELSLSAWRSGRGVEFTALVRDITQRKEALEAAHRYAAQLETANAELDAFAYSVSHDLRAPLRSIDGFARALEEDAGRALDTTARSHLARVRAAANRMAKLIDDLLALSRITRAPLRRTQVDLSGLARAVADELAENGAAGVRWTIAPGVAAEGDPDLLRAALHNLLDNAAKYSRPVAAPCVEFGADEADGAPRYYVRDNGVGFDMAYADKLFGPFQRLHSAQEFEGTGVGLATVARIVRRHGGRIWADSKPGSGTTFWFTLENGGPTA